jgi:hypothetical protein
MATARAVEPHTRRGQWAEANLLLRLGDAAGAVAVFGELVRHAPELRRPAWDACWNGGVAGEAIRRHAVPDDARDEYARYLLDRGRWDAAAEAAERASPQTLRTVFARMFDAGRNEEILGLWRRLAPGITGLANGDFRLPLRGYGLDWVIWPVEGVLVERREDEDGFRLDIEFTQPQNLGYAGVTHDFAVAPGREYRLVAEAAAEGIASGTGVRIEVASTRRVLAASEPFLRSTGWRWVELRFRPGGDERVCRLRVVRPQSNRLDNRIKGRFSLRRAMLEAVS